MHCNLQCDEKQGQNLLMVLGLQSPVYCSGSSQTVLLDQPYATHRKPETWAHILKCTCTCLPTITHGQDITILSDGCTVAPPTGCQKVDHVVARCWAARHALLIVEAAAACSARIRPRMLLAIEAVAARSALASLRSLCSPLRQIYNGNG